MDSTTITYVGLDVTPHRQPITLAAVDHRLELVNLQSGGISEILNFLVEQSRLMIAVNCPQSLNRELMDSHGFRQTLLPAPHPSHWTDLRVVEYLFAQNGISIHRTPAKLANAPKWMKRGFQLYAQLIDVAKCQLYPTADTFHQYFESHADAFFQAKLHSKPFEENSLEGRLQRQLVLYEKDMPVKDPMLFFEEVTRYKMLHSILPLEEILSISQLNALAMANTAWLAGNQPEELMRLGNPEEGWLYIPHMPELKHSMHQSTLL